MNTCNYLLKLRSDQTDTVSVDLHQQRLNGDGRLLSFGHTCGRLRSQKSKADIQGSDELKVYGDNATIEQMCQIKSQASLSCDRELIKIMLVLKAADISVEGCAEPSSLPLLETGW
jgi:hypothetical protein